MIKTSSYLKGKCENCDAQLGLTDSIITCNSSTESHKACNKCTLSISKDQGYCRKHFHEIESSEKSFLVSLLEQRSKYNPDCGKESLLLLRDSDWCEFDV